MIIRKHGFGGGYSVPFNGDNFSFGEEGQIWDVIISRLYAYDTTTDVCNCMQKVSSEEDSRHFAWRDAGLIGSDMYNFIYPFE